MRHLTRRDAEHDREVGGVVDMLESREAADCDGLSNRLVCALLRDALDGEGTEFRILFAGLPGFLERR